MNNNLRKFRKDFSSNNAYQKYLEKGKWRAGPVLVRKDYDVLDFCVKYYMGGKDNLEVLANVKNYANFFTTGYNGRNNRVLGNLFKLTDKYGVTLENLMRMYLHDRVYYSERKTGMSTLNKLLIQKRVKSLNLPSSGLNNSWNSNWFIYIKRNGEWKPGSRYNQEPKVNYVTKRITNAFPQLRRYEIPKPNDMINDSKRKRGGIWVKGINVGKFMKNQNALKLAKARYIHSVTERVRPTLENLLNNTQERSRVLQGFRETRGAASCLTNNARLLKGCGNLARASRGEAHGSIPTNVLKALKSPRLSLPFSSPFIAGNNAGNNPLKRKWNRPNSPNTAARKKAKENENARSKAVIKQLRNLSQVSARLRNNQARLRLAPPPGATWTRNKNGTIRLVDVNNRKKKLNRYIQYYINWVASGYNSRIPNLARGLLHELNLVQPVRGRVFHNDTVRQAGLELNKIIKYLKERYKEKKN
jgi:hypothetical protein